MTVPPPSSILPSSLIISWCGIFLAEAALRSGNRVYGGPVARLHLAYQLECRTVAFLNQSQAVSGQQRCRGGRLARSRDRACPRLHAPRDASAEQKFLNSPWNLCSFVGLATQRGDRAVSQTSQNVGRRLRNLNRDRASLARHGDGSASRQNSCYRAGV